MVSADVPPERKPERGYVRQNHPFAKPPFYLPVKKKRKKAEEGGKGRKRARKASCQEGGHSLFGCFCVILDRTDILIYNPGVRISPAWEEESASASPRSLEKGLEEVLGPSGPKSLKKASRRVRKVSKILKTLAWPPLQILAVNFFFLQILGGGKLLEKCRGNIFKQPERGFKLGCRKWGCNKWGLKGCLAALPGNGPKSPFFLPFSPFSGGSEEHQGNPENGGKRPFSSDIPGFA